MTEREAHFMERLLVEFPDWTNQQAYTAAVRIVEHARQAAFEMDAERGIAEIPITYEREATHG